MTYYLYYVKIMCASGVDAGERTLLPGYSANTATIEASRESEVF